MGKERHLSTAQAMRSAQLKMTHMSLTALEEAAAKAIAYQGKYMAAVENLISCMLDCSDAVEQTRALLGADGAERMTPTFEVTGQLSQSFEAWKSSAELLQVKHDFETLMHMCTVAKRTTRIGEEQEEQVVKYAARCAKKAPRVRTRGTSPSGSVAAPKRESASHTARVAKLEELNSASSETLKSLGVWWSGKLAKMAQSIIEDLARFGSATVRSFSPRQHSANFLRPIGVLRPEGLPGFASSGGATHVDAAAMDAASATGWLDGQQGQLTSRASSWRSSAATSMESSSGLVAAPLFGAVNEGGSAVPDSRVHAH